MNVLLDTHVILWIAFNSEKLSPKVIENLTSEDNKVYISSVSFWEISLKFNTGKLSLNQHTPESLLKAFKENFSFEPLDLSFYETVSFFKLQSQHHKDPFDRMLIWQALKNDLVLISDDRNMRLYKDTGLKVLW